MGLTNRPRLPMVPVILAGFAAFLNLYCTQPLLPLLARTLRASPFDVGLTITAPTVAIAITAPFIGRLADRLGLRRVIIGSAFTLTAATVLAGSSSSLTQLIVWRFVQGIATPGIFASAIAYIHEVWPATHAGRATAAYMSGTVLGGFTGRAVAGTVAASAGWPAAFVALGMLTGAAAVSLWLWLPSETSARRAGNAAHGSAAATDDVARGFNGTPAAADAVARGFNGGPAAADDVEQGFNGGPAAADEVARGFSRAAGGSFARSLRNRRLLATCGVGFCVLFTQVAMFTYVTFHLSARPFNLSTIALGWLFSVYLVGAVVTPFAGRWIDIHGHRAGIASAMGLGGAGALLTLTPSLPLIIGGLALCATGVFIAQATTSSYIGAVTSSDRAFAVGMYSTFYYSGGSTGGALPSIVWRTGGWNACVGLVVLVQAVGAAIALTQWSPAPARHDVVLPD